jgi:hypothetical protein
VQRGKSGARLLYWFRTPPNLRVGREPFSPAIRAELESNNADVSFDWRKILETPIPSADAELWRERRRVQKAERVARQIEISAPSEGDDSDDEASADEPVHVLEAATAKEGAGNVEEGTVERRRRRRRGGGGYRR